MPLENDVNPNKEHVRRFYLHEKVREIRVLIMIARRLSIELKKRDGVHVNVNLIFNLEKALLELNKTKLCGEEDERNKKSREESNEEKDS